MAKLTTLQIVQRTLSALDSDNVSSISDTVESEQILDILNTVYDRLLDDFPWYHLREYGTLEVTATAHIMKIPNDILQVDLIRYNKEDIIYVTPYEMTEFLDNRDITQSEVDSNGAYNDRDPSYWTSYDDEYITFDAYDGSLVASYTDCEFIRKPSTLTSDTDIPDLPDRLHTVLLDGVLEEAFRLFKIDERTAMVYQRKYIVGLGKVKRWARRINKKESSWGTDYGRKNYRG